MKKENDPSPREPSRHDKGKKITGLFNRKIFCRRNKWNFQIYYQIISNVKGLFVILYFSYNSRTYGKNILSLILLGYYAFSVEYDIEYSSGIFSVSEYSRGFFSQPQSVSAPLVISPRYHKILASLCSLFFYSRASLHFFYRGYSFAIGFPVVTSRIGSQWNEICPLTKFPLIHFVW